MVHELSLPLTGYFFDQEKCVHEHTIKPEFTQTQTFLKLHFLSIVYLAYYAH